MLADKPQPLPGKARLTKAKKEAYYQELQLERALERLEGRAKAEARRIYVFQRNTPSLHGFDCATMTVEAATQREAEAAMRRYLDDTPLGYRLVRVLVGANPHNLAW